MRIFAPLAFSFLVIAGCSSSPSTSCSSSANCSAGHVCVDSHCVSTTGDAGICGMGCQCTTSDVCLAGAPACVTAACVSGSCFFRTDDTRCAAGQTCDMLDGCVGTASDTGVPSDASGSTDAPTPSDAGTDAFTPDVGAPDSNTRSPLGGACRVASDCAPIMGAGGTTAECATASNGIPLPGGYCTIPCASFGNTCPAGSECTVSGGGGGAGICAVTCTSAMQCRASEGYVCQRPRRSLIGGNACIVPNL